MRTFLFVILLVIGIAAASVQDVPAKTRNTPTSIDPLPCKIEGNYKTWKTLYTDPAGRGTIDVSYRSNTVASERGYTYHFRVCNRLSVKMRILLKCSPRIFPKVYLWRSEETLKSGTSGIWLRTP
jgi:hypothetical protein